MPLSVYRITRFGTFWCASAPHFCRFFHVNLPVSFPYVPEERIGVDESGKGDYFGPLVVAACYVGPEHLAELEGVRESKKVTDKRAAALANRIRRTCPHKTVLIKPEKYNRLYEGIGNLNRLLAWAHARAIEDLLQQQPAQLVISDRFADPRVLERRLMERGRNVRVQSVVRAEADLAVAAASILARDKFLWSLKKLSEEWRMPLPKGAGPQTVQAAKEFVERHGAHNLAHVAKLHFRTTQAVLGAGQ